MVESSFTEVKAEISEEIGVLSTKETQGNI